MGNSKSGKTQSSSAGDSKPAKKTGAFQISSEPVVHGRAGDDVHKYEIAPQEPPLPQTRPAYEELGQLPESYGENTVFLIARDPKWLFTYWDVSPGSFSANTDGGKVFLKVLFENGAEQSLIEINLAARNWYIPVPDAATAYRVEIGYFDKGGEWLAVARSGTATTPADVLSEENEVDFATVPFHLSFQHLVDTVKAAMGEGESLISAISRLQGEGRKLAFAAGKAPAWSEEQRQVLIALLGTELVDRVGLGSAEIDQLLRKELMKKLSPENASALAAKGLWGPAVSSLFSGIGLWGPEVTSLFSGVGASWSAQPFSKPREFFMHVNAEVIFYGGTHPDAKVTIDGKKIKLNPDGTFRYHFKFPDGNYKIPVIAVSPDKVETRSATLNFERATTRKGDVGHTAQPKRLKKPVGKKR
jgi:uncharacterized protein